MCDYFWQRIMDQNNQQGDLTDIFRNSGISPDADGWHLPLEPAAADPFGDPFVDMGGGPLLDECFFNSADVKASGGGKEQKSSFFSRMLQISPPEIPPLPLVDGGGGLQISSSPRMQGIKRRKSQVKKVVCVPAPPAASGKTSGEVVPSDLWAWRKYGQKPIKGSPYPRGYYRCSSSKGCSARKQVERSRTDPNMLVITYTSEHNHPWPTQRNALAGSTRSQPSKGNNNASTSNNSPHNQNQPTNIKEEHKEYYSTSDIKLVKEEEAQDFDQVFDESFMMSNSSHPDDFFADLAELESDPMNLIFPKGLDEDRERNKVMDPFNMFDWEEAKRGL